MAAHYLCPCKELLYAVFGQRQGQRLPLEDSAGPVEIKSIRANREGPKTEVYLGA